MADRAAEEMAARRAKRAERRQKQRDANVDRAAKMHEIRLAAQPAGKNPVPDPLAGRVHIGCSGWYYWHWKGKFYPADIPSSQYFRTYQNHFKTVELNAPFYSWPTIGAVKTWIRQSDPGFVYTIKVCELITHIKRFEDFGYIADLLGPQMGCFLFQLPPSVRYTPGNTAVHFIAARPTPQECRRVSPQELVERGGLRRLQGGRGDFLFVQRPPVAG